MEEKSNLNVPPNLMLYDENYPPEGGNYKYFPGDLLGTVKRKLADIKAIKLELSPKQIKEYNRYLLCRNCGKTCAGICS